MTISKNVERVKPIERGKVITARYLNHVGEAVNRNTQSLSGPKQQQALQESESNAAAGVINLDFSEVSRASTAVQITDSNGDTHSIEQIDSVTFQNTTGDVLTLTFNNP